MTEREHIFARIREALTIAAPRPRRSAGERSAAESRMVLPGVGATFQENVALFQRNALELKADFALLDLANEVPARLSTLAAAEGWKRIATHKGALTDAACHALGLPVLVADGADSRPDKRELEQCDAGITECDALVAQTGSVVVTSRSAGGRALSVLPPHHVVLAWRAQLVGGLPDAFALLQARYGANYPSMISFITGPSRTGDIERILVLGAHGPKKLTIFCV